MRIGIFDSGLGGINVLKEMIKVHPDESYVYIGDNTYIENCIVESHDTIRANSNYVGDPENIKIVLETNARYVL